MILPCNISDLNDFMCASTNREGQLCGRCRNGFAPPVYSYSLTCVNCTDYSLNWLKYLAVAFGPLTVFSVIISVFHISPSSPYLHGFIFTANIMCSPNIIRMVVFFSLFGIWNLDFFRTVYKPCTLLCRSLFLGTNSFCCTVWLPQLLTVSDSLGTSF